MLTFYNKYAKNYFSSQNGEEGLIEEILKRIPIKEKNAVEIGGNNGLWLSNTAWLIKEHGWSGKFVEADFDLWQQSCNNWKDNPKVKSQCSFVNEQNVNAFITDDTTLLSIDCDGVDYKIFKAMEAKPPVVIIEIDSSIPPGQDGFNHEGGASYLEMVKLAIEKGYFLLCHTGNLVLVDKKYKKLFPEIVGDPLIDHDLYFRRDWLKQTA